MIDQSFNYIVVAYDEGRQLCRAAFDSFPDVALWYKLWQDYDVEIWLMDDDGPLQLK